MAPDDAWEDDWIPQVRELDSAFADCQKPPQQAPAGVVVVDSKDQIRRLFNPHTTTETPGNYEIQSNSPGSQFRPQLRILKRTPESTPSPVSSPKDARPGETEAERMERVRRDKEEKYRAARESIFGADKDNRKSSSPVRQANANNNPGILRLPKGPDGSAGFKRR